MMTGRYPWAAGFYDMKADTDHCTVNSTALPEMLKPLGCERCSQRCAFVYTVPQVFLIVRRLAG